MGLVDLKLEDDGLRKDSWEPLEPLDLSIDLDDLGEGRSYDLDEQRAS